MTTALPTRTVTPFCVQKLNAGRQQSLDGATGAAVRPAAFPKVMENYDDGVGFERDE
jgi:hypothetical protein